MTEPKQDVKALEGQLVTAKAELLSTQTATEAGWEQVGKLNKYVNQLERRNQILREGLIENLIKNGNHYPSNLAWEYDITIKILKWVLDEKTEEEQQDIAYKALMEGKAHL